ncbi:MAG: lipocalin family protein [Ferruginibacter sp.]
MKYTKLLCKILPFFLLLISCNNAETDKNKKMIIGNWSGAEWLIDGKPSNHNIQSTAFSFDDKGKYSFDYAGTKEEGTYKIENDMLYTTASKKLEIMVKITKLTQDSLVFDMNNTGQAETMTLLRK